MTNVRRPATGSRPGATRWRGRDRCPPTSGSVDGTVMGRLPEPVRARLAEAAATAVGRHGGATTCRVPLRRIAGFTPAKRARLGGPALLAELEGVRGVPGRRHGVVGRAPAGRARADAAADPLAAAAAAVLTGDPDAADAVAPPPVAARSARCNAERDDAAGSRSTS